MERPAERLFESADLVVRRLARDGAPGRRCFVTFDSYTDDRRLDRPGFGEHFFTSRGIDAIHVISRDNRWYQHPEFSDAVARVRAAVTGYGQVIAYGSSMGGFAALHYGSACGADIGLALSPQFTVDHRRPPHDRRWHADTHTIKFLDFEPAPLLLQYIVFDPADALDCAHAALFARRSPTVSIPIRNAGHPVGSYLVETEMFGALFDGVTSGLLTGGTAPGLVAELRRRRRRSGQLYFTLARRAVATGREARAIAFARRAAAARPENPQYRSYLGLFLDHFGRHEEAAEQHRQALAMASNFHMRRNLVVHHAVRGDADQAQALAAALAADYPDVPAMRECLAFVRRKRWQGTAAGRAARAVGIGPAINWIADRLAPAPSSPTGS